MRRTEERHSSDNDVICRELEPSKIVTQNAWYVSHVSFKRLNRRSSGYKSRYAGGVFFPSRMTIVSSWNRLYSSKIHTEMPAQTLLHPSLYCNALLSLYTSLALSKISVISLIGSKRRDAHLFWPKSKIWVWNLSVCRAPIKWPLSPTLHNTH